MIHCYQWEPVTSGKAHSNRLDHLVGWGKYWLGKATFTISLPISVPGPRCLQTLDTTLAQSLILSQHLVNLKS